MSSQGAPGARGAERAGGEHDGVTALLVLEDGRTFRGEPYGAVGETIGEAVFATGMTGYQETLTDPSYHRQVVVMTAPHIGNTGVNDEDPESGRVQVAGYVVRDPAPRPSSWRSRRSLQDELAAAGRGRGVRCGHPGADPAPARARGDAGRAVLSGDRPGRAAGAGPARRRGWSAPTWPTRCPPTEPYVVPAVGEKRQVVVALDLGIKRMTPRRMAERGIETHVLPAWSTPDEVLARDPDGVFVSNGPGDPAATDGPVAVVRAVLGAGVPLFGICFGNQILGRALGFGTYKLRYGHRGLNQPVRDNATGRVEVTAHNHGFAVDAPAESETRVRPGRGQPREPQRRRGRGPALPGPAGLQRAVPPRGGGRAARRRPPLRPLRRADGRCLGGRTSDTCW